MDKLERRLDEGDALVIEFMRDKPDMAIGLRSFGTSSKNYDFSVLFQEFGKEYSIEMPNIKNSEKIINLMKKGFSYNNSNLGLRIRFHKEHSFYWADFEVQPDAIQEYEKSTGQSFRGRRMLSYGHGNDVWYSFKTLVNNVEKYIK
jgi:hypothetical protein